MAIMRYQQRILKFAVGLVILFLLLYRVGFNDILQKLSSANFLFLLPAVLLAYLSIMLNSLNILILLRPLSVKVPYRRVLQYLSVGQSISVFLPGKLGEFSLVYFLRKEGTDLGKGAAVFFLDKMITMAVLSLVATTGFFYFFTRHQSIKLILLIIVVAVFSLSLFFTSFGRSLVRKILHRHSVKFKGFSTQLFSYFHHHKNLIFFNVLVTFAKLLVLGFAISFLILAVGLQVPIHYVVLIKAITTIISTIPISINGLGLKETTAVVLYNKLGFDPTSIAGAYVLGLILEYGLAFFFSTVYINDKLFFKSMRKEH